MTSLKNGKLVNDGDSVCNPLTDKKKKGYWINSNPFDLTSKLEFVEGEIPITPPPKPKKEAKK